MGTVVQAAVQADDILAGDWWFIRRQQIPLPDHAVETNRTHQKLCALSEKAGRLCTRQITTQLAGVRKWLDALQAAEAGQLEVVGRDVGRLRDRLDVPTGTPWSRKLDPLNTKDWTADFLHKLSILRNVRQAAPDVLDWAMHLTWLTQNKGQIPGHAIPLELLIYCAAALQFCTPFKPLEDLADDNESAYEGYKLDPTLPEWKLSTLKLLIRYRQRPTALLRQNDLLRLDHFVRNESASIFVTAKDVSQSLRELFEEWGLQL